MNDKVIYWAVLDSETRQFSVLCMVQFRSILRLKWFQFNFPLRDWKGSTSLRGYHRHAHNAQFCPSFVKKPFKSTYECILYTYTVQRRDVQPFTSLLEVSLIINPSPVAQVVKKTGYIHICYGQADLLPYFWPISYPVWPILDPFWPQKITRPDRKGGKGGGEGVNPCGQPERKIFAFFDDFPERML